ncbi:MAG: DUF1489 domain-containing protein [Novosphingobium sp.]
MTLHLTKIAYGCASVAELRDWLEAPGPEFGDERRMVTRYLPKRHAELAGGSLYWIHEHALVGRTPLIGFTQREEDARWWIRLEPRLIAIEPRARRAHQGWRYLEAGAAPRDLAGGESGEMLPSRLLGELAKLGLV